MIIWYKNASSEIQIAHNLKGKCRYLLLQLNKSAYGNLIDWHLGKYLVSIHAGNNAFSSTTQPMLKKPKQTKNNLGFKAETEIHDHLF